MKAKKDLIKIATPAMYDTGVAKKHRNKVASTKDGEATANGNKDDAVNCHIPENTCVDKCDMDNDKVDEHLIGPNVRALTPWTNVSSK